LVNFIHLVNDSKAENEISGNFYLPIYEDSKVMIGGLGQSVIIKDYTISPINKSKTQFSGDKKNCECCILF